MTPEEIQNMVVASIKQLIGDAFQQGLTWRRIPATVVNGSDPINVQVVLDGDVANNALGAVSLTGGAVTDSRVMVDIVPPAGMFIIGDAGPAPRGAYRFVGFSHITTTSDLDTGDFTGIQLFDVELWGSGGGGGGAAATAAGQAAVAAGGGGGGYSRKFIYPSDIGTGGTITIGAAGTIGSNTGGAGGDGGSVDFLGIFSASGGGGGEGGAAGSSNVVTEGGSGGLGSGGDIDINGGDGGNGARVGATATMLGVGGATVGDWGSARRVSAGNDGGPGIGAYLYGNGGSGAFNFASQSGRTGGLGSLGIARMTLYI